MGIDSVGRPGNTHVLMCSRSSDDGATWSEPQQIPASLKAPPSIRAGEPGMFECYPGTCTALPSGEVLVTWDYRTFGYLENGGGDYERALLYTLSADDGATWSDQHLIFDPVDPPDASREEVQHLGWVRHIVLPWPDGRWLLPLAKLNKHGKHPG